VFLLLAEVGSVRVTPGPFLCGDWAMQETNEISIHEIRVFAAVSSAQDWVTSKQVASQAAVAGRTARLHLLKLTRLGLLDGAAVFPCHRYKAAEKADKRNFAYLQRITQAAEVFGVRLPANATDRGVSV
jgi:hypothetical protein